MNIRKPIISILLMWIGSQATASSLPDYYPILGSSPNRSKYAESLFNQLELISGLNPATTNASFSEDGYFYRDYGSTRFGVKQDGSDPGYYKSIEMGPWQLIGSYKDTDAPRVIIIGRINSGFAKAVANDATLLSSNVATNAPIIISKKFNDITSEEKNRLLTAYKSGLPIAAFNPTPADLVKLRKLMGLPESNNPNARYILAGIYKTATQTSTLKITKPILIGSQKHALDYSNQAAVLFRWIRDSERANYKPNLKALGIQSDNPVFFNLHDLSNADVNEVDYDFNGANYNIQTGFSTVLGKDGQYYIYGNQRGRMAQRGAYQWHNDIERNGLASYYAFENNIKSRYGSLVIDSPPTTQGESQITNGISWSIGGAFEFGGSGLASGIEVQSLHSYSIPDVTIQNTSDSYRQSVKYLISKPIGDRVPDVAYNTFTAMNEFVLKIDKRNPTLVDQRVFIENYDITGRIGYNSWGLNRYRQKEWKDTYQPILPTK